MTSQADAARTTLADALAITTMALICSAVVACGILFAFGGFSS